MCGAFLRHATKHYVKRGRVTDEVASYKVVLRHLKDLLCTITEANKIFPGRPHVATV